MISYRKFFFFFMGIRILIEFVVWGEFRSIYICLLYEFWESFLCLIVGKKK